MGQNPKIGSKMGAPTPKWDPIGFDNHNHIAMQAGLWADVEFVSCPDCGLKLMEDSRCEVARRCRGAIYDRICVKIGDTPKMELSFWCPFKPPPSKQTHNIYIYIYMRNLLLGSHHLFVLHVDLQAFVHDPLLGPLSVDCNQPNRAFQAMYDMVVCKSGPPF